MTSFDSMFGAESWDIKSSHTRMLLKKMIQKHLDIHQNNPL